MQNGVGFIDYTSNSVFSNVNIKDSASELLDGGLQFFHISDSKLLNVSISNTSCIAGFSGLDF